MSVSSMSRENWVSGTSPIPRYIPPTRNEALEYLLEIADAVTVEKAKHLSDAEIVVLALDFGMPRKYV